jgi:hypothetical protein
MKTKKLLLGVCALAAVIGTPKVIAETVESILQKRAEHAESLARMRDEEMLHRKKAEQHKAAMDGARSDGYNIMEPLILRKNKAENKLRDALLAADKATSKFNKWLAERRVASCRKALDEAVTEHDIGFARFNVLQDQSDVDEAAARQEERLADIEKNSRLAALKELTDAEQLKYAAWRFLSDDEAKTIEEVTADLSDDTSPFDVIEKMFHDDGRCHLCEYVIDTRGYRVNRYDWDVGVNVLEDIVSTIKSDYYAKVDRLRAIEFEAACVKASAIEAERQASFEQSSPTDASNLIIIEEANKREAAARDARLQIVNKTLALIGAAYTRYNRYRLKRYWDGDQSIRVSTGEEQSFSPNMKAARRADLTAQIDKELAELDRDAKREAFDRLHLHHFKGRVHNKTGLGVYYIDEYCYDKKVLTNPYTRKALGLVE